MRILSRSLLVVLMALLPAVAGAAPAGGPPNDPLYEMQWGLRSIHAVEAWAVSQGAGAEVAVVDSGIDGRHPDLKKKLSPRGWACGRRASSLDRSGHGTHVAGIIGAEANNGVGVAGVAPAASLISVRRAGPPSCEYADAVRAAADSGADVINMSQGYGPEGYAYGAIGRLNDTKAAVEYAWEKGAVVVVSAGNSRQPLCAEPWLNAPVVCVGALSSTDAPASYTNRDLVMQSNYVLAPGGDGLCEAAIVSTYVRESSPEKEATCELPQGYAALNGTSMAAPHVSGVAALLAALGLNNEEIVECLLSQTDDLGPEGRDPIFGYGKVNAQKAVTNCA